MEYFGKVLIDNSKKELVCVNYDLDSKLLECVSAIDTTEELKVGAIVKRYYYNESEVEIIDTCDSKKLEKILRVLSLNTVNAHAKTHVVKKSDDGLTLPINYGGRFYDEKEVLNLVDASLDFWLTNGRYCAEFEKKFAAKLGVSYCSLTNSGSSANLLAFMTLTSYKLGDKRIKKGDEVITVAAGFPTTVTPIIQYGAIPVFVDVDIPSYNIDVNQLEAALSNKTKAVMIAHTLGNPFNLASVREFCDKHELWLVEDNCDALGSTYEIDGNVCYTGTVGDIGTSSFYPPHHITMGEGGAVYTDNLQLKRLIESFRDWGRDCWCPSGKDNTCNCRFTKQFGELPVGYDHKYVYSHLGYNLKVTEMQAAIGCAQLEKLDYITDCRRKNWSDLRSQLMEIEDYLILPEAEANSNPSWFGFLLTLTDKCKFTRNELTSHLESKKIQTRTLFAGNLIKHPCFVDADDIDYRVVGQLDNTDRIMNSTFWIGVYPGLNKHQIEYMAETIVAFIEARK